MAAQGRVGAGQGTADGRLREGVGGDLGVVLQREVGDGVLHLGEHLQQQAARPGGRRAQVGVAEGVGDGAVQIVEEEAQLPARLLVAPAVQEGVDEGVQIAQVHREVGDGRHMAVERHQGKEQLVQILGRRQAEKSAALADKRSVVGQNVPGAVGGVPLKEVVDGAGLKEMAGAGRDVQHVEGIFRLLGQVHQLLLVGKGLRGQGGKGAVGMKHENPSISVWPGRRPGAAPAPRGAGGIGCG